MTPLGWAMGTSVALGVLALVTAVALFLLSAPYGRHARAGFGPSLPSRWGWVVMESPAVFGFAIAWASGPLAARPAALVLGTLWLCHYVYRTLVYPFRIASRPMPVLVAALAFAFQSLNAPSNGLWLAYGGLPEPWAPRLWLGASLFVAGWLVNFASDEQLRELRRRKGPGYHVPDRGLHRLVAAPNYLGECVEWLGFAIAAGSPPAWAFAAYTVANLAPRARSHLRWYREQFGAAYPTARRALVPYLW